MRFDFILYAANDSVYMSEVSAERCSVNLKIISKLFNVKVITLKNTCACEISSNLVKLQTST